MEAGTLLCPQCGAPAAPDLAKCTHCGCRLAKVSCPSCFAMVFEGAKFCASCGAKTSRLSKTHTKLPCPKCKKTNLGDVDLGHTPVHECARCHGLFVDASTFDRICTDRERQSAVLGSASTMFRPGKRNVDMKVQYVRCPVCAELMHRVNFAKCSGIIVDVCKGHGTWSDRDELQHIVEFIRTGGLDLYRQREKAELESARRRLESARTAGSMDRPYERRSDWAFSEGDLAVIAGSLISKIFR
jgi:Zn-finger nucleic acid-binding protein